MQRADHHRVDAKRRVTVDPKKQQFSKSIYKNQEYHHKLNFYSLPPTADVTLEEFEEWAISRLKVLSELETCTFRNKSPEETSTYMQPILEKHLPLSTLQEQRRKDHYSHFILRLAFASTEDLRRRFSRLETMLFRLRYKLVDGRETQEFINSLGFNWEMVSDKEKAELAEELKATAKATPGYGKKGDEESYFKVEWERVPELVEHRRVLIKRGMAFVPVREQMSLVVAEFTRRLDIALEQTARALPRLDEDDRLSPILAHLSRSFTAPDATFDTTEPLPGELRPTAANIDALSSSFPLCMSHLHSTLRANSHLKHFGRLQYSLFLKGIGLSLEECILFWRRSFKSFTDEKFAKEYRYNIRHVYGDVGGDARRGRGYPPYSCQKLLTEPLPSAGQTHGCPYRTFSPDNLISMLSTLGVSDRDLQKQIREDVGKQRYHVACNRVFEHSHKKEIKEVKDKGLWNASQLDTILHPNEYFKRSFKLKHLGDGPVVEVEAEANVKNEDKMDLGY